MGANISFLLGCVLLWVALLLTPWTFNDSLIVCISLWVVSIVLLTLGGIFSFVLPRQYIVFKAGKLYVNGQELNPNKIKTFNRITNFPKSKNLYLQSMYYDLEIELQSGEKIVCPKFDSISNLRGKIRVIKSLYNKRESELCSKIWIGNARWVSRHRNGKVTFTDENFLQILGMLI